ncbi:hypothetical protein ACVI55_005197 [Sinorhizobium medicae]
MDGRSNFIMDGVALPIGRAAQGDENEFMPRSFKAQQFLCDERFRKARITLQHDGDLRFRGHVSSVRSFHDGQMLFRPMVEPFADDVGYVHEAFQPQTLGAERWRRTLRQCLERRGKT